MNNSFTSIGIKYQTMIDDKIETLRVIELLNEDALLKNLDTSDTFILSEATLKNKYVKINPDAFINIFFTDMDSEPDMYIFVHKTMSMVHSVNNINYNTPDIIARQYYTDSETYDVMNPNNLTFGFCIPISSETNKEFIESITQFKNIDYFVSVAVYADDTVDSIIETLSRKIYRRINSNLKAIKADFNKRNKENIYTQTGLSNTLKEFFENVSFIGYFRQIFNILKVDWPIAIDNPSNEIEDGVYELNKLQIEKIENILNKVIKPISCIEYKRDIDIKKIVSFEHIMISDETEKIYLFVYETIQELSNVDNDIAKAMGYNS